MIERTYLLSRLGRFDVLVEANWVAQLEPSTRALASTVPVMDVADRLSADAGADRLAAKIVDRHRVAWLILGLRAELRGVLSVNLKPLPPWARASAAPILGVATLDGRDELAFELDLDRLLDELFEGSP